MIPGRIIVYLFVMLVLSIVPYPAMGKPYQPAWVTCSVRQGQDYTQVVRAIQYLLRSRGYTIVVDGSFGRQTERVVKLFQKKAGLKADGIVGPATWPHLIKSVRRGSRGDAVRAVQLLLNPGGFNVTVDGIFAQQTEAAVKDFQRMVEIKRDGLVGSVTWRWLVDVNRAPHWGYS